MSEPNFQDVDKMNPGEEAVFYERLLAELRQEDDSAARANLAAGVPVYYRHEAFQEPGQIIRHYPNGRMERVRIAADQDYLCMSQPQLWLVAGPNGAGKNTLADR